MAISRSGHKVEFNVNFQAVSEILKYKEDLGEQFPKIGVLVVSYNAESHIVHTLERIPQQIYSIIEEIFIFDDCSSDNTFEIIKEEKKISLWKKKLNLFKNPTNLMYGGNQKAGYSYAISRGLDFVIMLHGDGQYAPEYIPDLILPALNASKPVIFGSRLINRIDALKGGMPFYKFIGNQILSKFENLILGTKLYEFHSGYRMYSTKVLQQIPFEENTNDFHFDTEIIIQCRALGITIHEVPIKTYYGDEECNVNGFKYAKDVILSVLEYRLHQLHIIRKGRYLLNRHFVYTKKNGPYSSHEIILKKLSSGLKNRTKLLEFGGGHGLLFAAMRNKGAEVVCADYERSQYSEVPEEYFISLKTNSVNQLGLKREFDFVVLSDNLAKSVDDFHFLKMVKKYVKADGTVIIVVPNIAIWFYRLSLLIGRFNYGNKGVLDRKNLHFYTKSTIFQLLKRTGYRINRIEYSNIPFEIIFESIGKSKSIKYLDFCYHLLVKIWPQLFSYQFVLEAKITRFNFEDGEGKVS